MKKNFDPIHRSAITVIRSADRLEIELKWRSFDYILALILGIVGITVMLSTQWETLTFTGFTFQEKPFSIVICGVALVLLAFIYYCIARFFNKTKLDFFENNLFVTHGPIPFHKNSIFSLSDINSFEVNVRREKTNRGEGPPFFRVEAVFLSGKRKMITAYHEDEELIGEIARIVSDYVKGIR
jgi:hypothetical protein